MGVAWVGIVAGAQRAYTSHMLTPAKVAQLEAIGVQNPAAARWVRLPGVCRVERMAAYAMVCNCRPSAPPAQVFMVPVVRDDGARLLVGQCPHCQVVRWIPWPRGEWLGENRGAPHGV